MNTTTKFIGIKEFRQHMALFAKTAREQKQRIVVMNRNRPLFTVTPFAEDEYLDTFVNSMVKAEADIAAGRVVSHDELVKRLGLE